jgi:hypothetical protein
MRCAVLPTIARRQAALMRFAAPRSVDVQPSLPPIGSRLPRTFLPFGLGPGLFRLPFTDEFLRRYILPRALLPLQSTGAPHPPRAPRGHPRSLRAPSMGFLPSSRRQPAASTSAAASKPPLRSVLGVPPALDGLLRHRPCRFVSPRSRVQGSPFRGSFLRRSRTGSSPAVALLSLNRLACKPELPRSCSSSTALAFRALLRTGVSSLCAGVTRRRTDSPLELRLLRVRLPSPWSRFHGPSLHGLCGSLLRIRRWTFEVSPTRGLAVLF